MAVRLTRGERKQQIRSALVDAARRVFLRRGFHGASLEEISAEAGCTKGAVYSNFAGKDELFLAVLDEQISRRARVQTARITAAATFAEGLRAAGRAMAEMASQSPRWTPVLVEFWTHASRQPALRARVAERHERMLEQYGELFTQLAPRFGVEFTIPVKEVARSGAAFGRGMALEQLLDPRGVTSASFEDLYATHLLALTKPRSGRAGAAERA